MEAYMRLFRYPGKRFFRMAFWRDGGCSALLLAVMCQSGWAQKNISDWKNVEALAPGSGIWVHTIAGKKYHVELLSVTDEKLALSSDEPRFPGRRLILREVPRERVREVRSRSQWISVAVGMAIGGGIGAGIGAGLDASARKPNDDPGLATGLFATLGSAIGSAVSSHATLIKGKTIYRAP
jgi:hypothetical protein